MKKLPSVTYTVASVEASKAAAEDLEIPDPEDESSVEKLDETKERPE